VRKPTFFLIPCLIGAALLAGCGGGDDSSSTEAALSKSAYVKQANAICKQSNDQIEAESKQEFGNQQPTQKQIEQFASNTAIPAVEDQLSQLRALPAPSGDEETVAAIYDAAQEGVDKAKKDPSIIAQDNPAAFAKANKLARDYGLDVCAG
jgi:hypothetical protein